MAARRIQKTLFLVTGFTLVLSLNCTQRTRSKENKEEVTPVQSSIEDSVITSLKYMQPVPVRLLKIFKIVDSNLFRVNKEMDAYCDTTVQLSNDVFYSIISVPDEMGVCSYYYIISLDDKTNQKITSQLLHPDCDSDFSQEEYTFFEHHLLTKNRIVVKKTTVYNKPGANSLNEEENIDRKEVSEQYYTLSDKGVIQIRQ